jgi:hypothetical protein
MNNKNLETVNKPNLLEKTVLSKYDDGTTTREIYTEFVQIKIVKSPNNDVNFFGHISPHANKRDLVDKLTSLTQQNIANILCISQSNVSRTKKRLRCRQDRG